MTDNQPGDHDEHRRNHPRKHTEQFLMVFDRTDGHNIGRLMDVSLGGLQLRSSAPVQLHKHYQFSMVLPSEIGSRNTISFDAVCLRSIQAENSDHFYSGFKIDEIDPKYVEILQSLIEQL